MTHLGLIKTYCEVLDQRGDWAIWYVDNGYKYADVFDPAEGWCSYSCDSLEMWEMLVS